jgi:uncharacterized delta-60 repeat protein
MGILNIYLIADNGYSEYLFSSIAFHHMKITYHLTVALVAGMVVFATRELKAAPGQLDFAFGAGGKATFSFGSCTAYSIAVQGDGKLLVGGEAFVANNDFALVRFNTDGSLDTGFGSSGKVTTDFSGSTDFCTRVRTLSDGRILAAGTADGNGGKDFAVARYLADGSLDTTFDPVGHDGKVHFDFGMGNDETSSDMVVQPDGKIVLVGYVNTGTDTDYGIMRLNPDGSLDTTFNATGRQTVDFVGTFDVATSVVLQPDGRILVAGYSVTGGFNFSLARLNADGSLDTTFGTGGIVTTDVNPMAFDYCQRIIVLRSGKILATGTSNSDFVLVRYTAKGELDPTFGTGGIVTTDIDGTAATAYDLAELSDGKILAAGSTAADFSMVCYNANGSLDTTFGVGGKVVTDMSGNTDQCHGLAVLTNGKILLAGTTDSSSNFGVARYAAALITAATDAPTLRVNGKKKRLTTRSRIALRGFATGSVTSVTCKLGKKTRPARGTTAWKLKVQLKPGKNKLTLVAHGPGGDSRPVKVVVTRK